MYTYIEEASTSSNISGKEKDNGQKIIVSGTRSQGKVKTLKVTLKRLGWSWGGEGHLVSMSNQFITKRIIFPIIEGLILNVQNTQIFLFECL